MEAVTDILSERMRQPRGMNRTMVVSLLAHAVLLTAFFLLASLGPPSTTEREVMTISLGGARGRRMGGMPPMGGRPVQARPLEDTPRRAPVTPPAAQTPEMVLPTQRTPPVPKPRTPVKTAPPEATSRTPTRGAEPQEGSAIAETGGRGLGFGLATGGG